MNWCELLFPFYLKNIIFTFPFVRDLAKIRKQRKLYNNNNDNMKGKKSTAHIFCPLEELWNIALASTGTKKTEKRHLHSWSSKSWLHSQQSSLYISAARRAPSDKKHSQGFSVGTNKTSTKEQLQTALVLWLFKIPPSLGNQIPLTPLQPPTV